MNSKDLIHQPEGRRLEFKSKLSSKSNLAKTVIAFSNDAGGDIYFGVSDNPREIIGINEDEIFDFEEKISNIISDSCKPTILPDISTLNIDGKYLLKVKVHRGNNPPYYLKKSTIEDGTYIRVGSTNRLADDIIIAELKRRKANIPFDGLLEHRKEVNELDYSEFAKHFKEITGEELNKTTLAKLRLFRDEQGKELPTYALILLSNDELRYDLFPNAKIECARFKGITPNEFIDRKTIDEPLSFQAEKAYQFVLRHISQSGTDVGVYRKDRWEYPIAAIREAIRNAVIHRDYSLVGKDIKVAIFDNRIEITSPGLTLPSVDFSRMESSQSDVRNRTLAPAFKMLGIIDQWGKGLPLIANEMKSYKDVILKWDEPGISFKLIFERKKQADPIINTVNEPTDNKRTQNDRLRPTNGRKKSKTDAKRPITTDYDRLRPIVSDYDRLSEEYKKVLLHILDNKKITKKEAVKLLNLGDTKTKEIFNEMIANDLIDRKGKGRSTYYVLSDKGEM